MTEPPKVDHSGSKPVVVLTYTDGDRCPKVTKKKFSTTVTLVCSTEQVRMKLLLQLENQVNEHG